MNEYKLFTQRIGLIGISNLMVGLSGIILIPILTKTLSIEDYGIWAQIMVTIGLIPSIVMLGLPYAMVRFLAGAKKKEDISEGFYSIAFIVLITSAVSSILLFLASDSIAAILFDGNIDVAKTLSALVFVECLNSLMINYFRTFQRIRKYSTFTLIRTYLDLIVVAYFVLSGYGILGATMGLLITKSFTLFIMATLVIAEIGFRMPKFTNIRDYLAFGLPTVPANLSSWVVTSSDRYVIGILLSTAFVGYYSPGYALGNTIQMFVAPLGVMLPAVLSKYYDENKLEETKAILKYSLKYFLLLAIPSAVGLSLLSRSILLIISTPEIASEGYLITPFVAVSAVLFGGLVVINHILVLEKKTAITGSIYILAAALNFGLNLILIPYIGILGAAIATLVAYLSIFIIGIYYSFKYLTFDIDLYFILKSLFASIVMSLIIIRWNPEGLSSVLITICACAVVYSTVLLILKGISREELIFFKNLFQG
ncbi:MAG: oligosaccharide flippase family protein [Methanothrix sp.]|nr:oligosaccharide flippase family protein [Methanothrix sp.]